MAMVTAAAKYRMVLGIILVSIICCLFLYMLLINQHNIPSITDSRSIHTSFTDIEMQNVSSITLSNLLELAKHPLVCAKYDIKQTISNISIVSYVKRCVIGKNSSYIQMKPFLKTKGIHTGFVSDSLTFKHVFKSGGTTTHKALSKIYNALNIPGTFKRTLSFYETLRVLNITKSFKFSYIRYNPLKRFLSGFFEIHKRVDMTKWLKVRHDYYDLDSKYVLDLWLNELLNTTNYITSHLLPQFSFLTNWKNKIIDFDYIGYTMNAKKDLYKILRHIYGEQINHTVFDALYEIKNEKSSGNFNRKYMLKSLRRKKNVNYTKYVLEESSLTDSHIKKICELLYLDIICLPIKIPKQCNLREIFKRHYGKDVIYQTCNGKQILLKPNN
eukprot:139682_1